MTLQHPLPVCDLAIRTSGPRLGPNPQLLEPEFPRQPRRLDVLRLDKLASAASSDSPRGQHLPASTAQPTPAPPQSLSSQSPVHDTLDAQCTR